MEGGEATMTGVKMILHVGQCGLNHQGAII